MLKQLFCVVSIYAIFPTYSSDNKLSSATLVFVSTGLCTIQFLLYTHMAWSYCGFDV
jgi:hypothetical protein